MKKNKIDLEIKTHYKNSDGFTRDELFQFYRSYEPDLKESTFAWRLYDLKRKSIIYELKTGVYRIIDKPIYIQKLEKELEELYDLVSQKFHNPGFVIWSTAWINEFSRHQTFNNIIILEAPSDMTESLFNTLKECEVQNVFLKPSTEQIYNYMIGTEHPILIKNLILKSPINKQKQYSIPTLEKILVDLYCDEKTYYMYQGNEMEEIFKNALDKYAINFTKLIQYARRRGKNKELQSYLMNNFQHEVGNILND